MRCAHARPIAGTPARYPAIPSGGFRFCPLGRSRDVSGGQAQRGLNVARCPPSLRASDGSGSTITVSRSTGCRQYAAPCRWPGFGCHSDRGAATPNDCVRFVCRSDLAINTHPRAGFCSDVSHSLRVRGHVGLPPIRVRNGGGEVRPVGRLPVFLVLPLTLWPISPVIRRLANGTTRDSIKASVATCNRSATSQLQV